jgi:hypothetical protein
MNEAPTKRRISKETNTKEVKIEKRMLKTKLFTAIALVAALLLLAPAAYAAEDTTTGSFGAKAKPPVVESIEIHDGTTGNPLGGPGATMTPQELYFARLNVTCQSKLKHLKTVQATIYYDEDGVFAAPVGGGDTQKLAILTWTAATDTWSIDPAPGPGTTWVLETGSCVHADVTGSLTNGDWDFYFKPGKVATEAPSASYPSSNWDAEGLAIDKTDVSSAAKYLVHDKGMVWYGEITLGGGTADWVDVDLGLVFSDEPPNPKPAGGLSINYIANGNYYENIASEDWDDGAPTPEVVTLREDWSDNGNPPDVAGEFALKANNDLTLADAVTVQKVGTGYVHIGDAGAQTGEAGVDVAKNSLWLSLSATGIYPGTYTGSIWYQVAER